MSPSLSSASSRCPAFPLSLNCSLCTGFWGGNKCPRLQMVNSEFNWGTNLTQNNDQFFHDSLCRINKQVRIVNGSTSRSVTVQAGLIVPPSCTIFCISEHTTSPEQPETTLATQTVAVPQSTDPPVSITRITYAIAGQTVAVRVLGDPNPDNNGLFHLHTDRQGSIVAVSDDDGNPVEDISRFYPYGSPRSGSSSEITDRGYTGLSLYTL